MKKTKNLKGFTLVEEVVSLFILSILILVASGMMIAAMRVYSVNVKTQSAQNKGQYVYDLLDEKLTYASGIQYQKIGETETLNPQNETYFKGGEVKKIFEDDEVCQNITVDKNGITNSFNNKKIEFGQYNVDVSLELETQATTAASASADNSMNDEALFNLVSNSEVTDSAGYLTPQGEVSFLGGLEIMNQSAEVRTVAYITNNNNGFTLKFDNDDNQFDVNFDLSKYDYSNVKRIVVVYEKVPTENLQMYSPDWSFQCNFNYKDNNKMEAVDNSEGKVFSYILNENQKLKDKLIIKNWHFNENYGSRLSEIQFYYSADEGIKETTAPITTTNNTTTTTGKTKTLKIDNSDADKDITLWAGETSQTFTLSSTLENVNSIYIEKKENYPIGISSKATKNENGDFVFDGNFTLTLTALKPASGQPTDFELKVYDRYYFKDQSSLSITDNKGLPITIRVHIKVPQINTNSITMYKNESTDINIGDIPFDYMSCSSDTATIVKAEKNNGKITLTSFDSETTKPVKITLTYNCNGVIYNFNIDVNVEEEPSEEVSEDSSDEQPPASSDEDEASSENPTNSAGTPMSSYRLKLTVTVRDKKGKEMYKRSGSISVMNYGNDNIDKRRFPKKFLPDGSLTNTSDNYSGFILKIYYID